MGVRAVPGIAHPTVEQRKARGRESRQRTPPSDHGGWRAAADRPDPVALLKEQNLTREPDLVPVRHGRMMVSPFTFYRGAAKIMAADLKDTPVAGLVPSCAATPTCRTSAPSPPPNGRCCSTSTTSTKPFPGRSSMT